MADDLHQAIDNLFQGEVVSPETVKTIGTLLLREQEGRTAQEIGTELNLPPEEVKALAVRARGWEMSHRLEEEKERRSRYQ